MTLCRLIGLAALLTGCVSPAPAFTRPPAPTADPAGLWLGLPAAVFQIPAPLPAGAPALQAEMQELHTLRAGLTETQRAAVTRWDNAALAWNQIARELVAKYKLDPLEASRVYALVSVAQYDAWQAAARWQAQYGRQLPEAAAGGVTPLVPAAAPGTYPSAQAALAGAAATILQQYIPQAGDQIARWRAEAEDSRLWAGVNCRSDVTAGDALGQSIAAALVARTQSDLTRVQWEGRVPAGAGRWVPDPPAPQAPLRPEWGQLTPWLMTRPDEFRAPPPPAFDSAEYQAALAEVRRISDTRTPEQLRIATFWADNPGTITPPGHWNQIAAEQLQRSGADNLTAARVLAYLNMGLMDAGISAWDTKYAYWLIRPFNADPAITTPIGRPSHPSYTSGHATFSGAAAEFLGVVFPDQRAAYAAMAEEAALSRVYGGIHYRFDGEQGLSAGRKIGQLAAERYLKELAAP